MNEDKSDIICKHVRFVLILWCVLCWHTVQIQAQNTTPDMFEVISLSNIKRLQRITSWRPTEELSSLAMNVIPSESANVALVTNRRQHLTTTINLETGELGHIFRFETETAISANGKFGCVADYTSLDVWNTLTGNSDLRIELQRTNAEMNDTDFSPQSDLFVYTSSSYTELSSEDGIYIYDLATQNQISMLAHPGAIQATFSPNGGYLVSAAYDGSIRLWNLERRLFRNPPG